jgi:1-deoxy-D-xylulose-5-phosphate reductoisomerase
MRHRRLIILGSTGSIGVNTLEVVAHLRETAKMRLDVVGLATGSRAEAICRQAAAFGVPSVAVAGGGDHECLRSTGSRVFRGSDAALELVEAVARKGDLVVGAMVGSAGIPAILAAIDRGCDIALANKETLVAAGAIVMPLVRAKGVHLLPVDSEHSAIFQCLESPKSEPLDASVARIILTASGGPFRKWSADRIAQATVDEALNHPTWNMGPKVTIDSASLMNKALEIIEAHWLFGLPADRIDAIIHPQSIVHGLVEFTDGSVLAQLSPPDMKTPIQHALTWPDRCDGISRKVNWATLGRLDFEPIDEDRFIAPSLARRAIITGGNAGAVLNAANEAAVQAFLERRISFGRIIEIVQATVEAIGFAPVHTMQDVLAADAAARAFVGDRVGAASAKTVAVSH